MFSCCFFVKRTKDMKILKSLSREGFKEKFGTKEQCLSYLSNEKWGDFYTCIKCKKTKYSEGRKAFNRRCSKCGHDESATANTLFHKVKFGIDKAFEMAYDISTSKKRASSIWLAEFHGVRQMTAWLFRRKVQQAMKSSEEFLLEKEVYVDESEIGTPQKGEQGRSKSENKVRVVIALEYRRGKTERGYAKIIDDYSSKSLEKIFHKHISKDAKITTDVWSGYKFLMKEYPHFEQKLSNKEQNFKMLHIQIRNFQNWLRGVHSYCSKDALNQYVEEYFFRFNRMNFRNSILDKLLSRIVK